MNDILFHIQNIGVTPWKLVGYFGTFLFTARWFVQFYATKKLRRVTVPMSFWYLSVVGSLLSLSYFIWGKNDSVGIMQTAFPMFVSFYNLFAHVRYNKPEVVAPGGPEET